MTILTGWTKYTDYSHLKQKRLSPEMILWMLIKFLLDKSGLYVTFEAKTVLDETNRTVYYHISYQKELVV